MKVYIARRVSWGEGEISKLADDLETRSHEITLKWWQEKVKKPFLKNIEHSQVLAQKIDQFIKKSNVLFLFLFEDVVHFCMKFDLVKYFSKFPTLKHDLAQKFMSYTHPSVLVLQNVDDIKERPWY